MKNKTKNTKNVPSKKQLKKITIDAKKAPKNQIKDSPKEEEWKKIQWLLCINGNHFPDIRFIFKQFQLFLFTFFLLNDAILINSISFIQRKLLSKMVFV